MKFQQAVNPTTLVTLPFIIFLYKHRCIGIQSFFDIAVHINALIKHVSFLTPNILFLHVLN